MIFRRRQLVHLVCLRHDAKKNGGLLLHFVLLSGKMRLEKAHLLNRRQTVKYKASDGGCDIINGNSNQVVARTKQIFLLRTDHTGPH